MTNRQDEQHCSHAELAVGWALHALEPEQEALLRQHLPTCARCRETVRDTEDIGAVLAEAGPMEEPSPQLRDRLLAAVDETPQLPTAGPLIPAEPEQVDPVVRQLPPRRRLATWPKVLVAAALVVLAVAAGTLAVRVGQLSEERDTQAAISTQLGDALSAFGDPEAHTAVLNDSAGDPAAILVSGKEKATVIPIALTPNNPSDQVFVMWGTSAGEPVALATFDVRETKDKGEPLSWSPDAAKHSGFAISLEPGRTAPAAPTSMIASGKVTT